MHPLSRLGLLLTLPNILAGCSLATVSAIDTNSMLIDATQFSSTMSREINTCNRQFLKPEPIAAQGFDPARIELLNWNIKKGQMPDWQSDLTLLGEGKQLVLIQEATQSMRDSSALPTSSIWNFAPGYSSRKGITGVATASQIKPLSACKLTAYEPWSRTPKATSITKFALSDSPLSLLVVNTHLINFALGLTDYRDQLSAISAVLHRHSGPVIISGDFNTWRPGRYKLLDAFFTDLGFEEITFAKDRRLRFFGSTLDHIFVAGVSVLQSETHEVSSSDHNPMTLSMSVEI